MKRVFICFFIVILIVGLPITAVSANKYRTYTLKEVGVSFEVSTDLVVFTRDEMPSQSYMAKYGLDSNEILASYKETGTYFEAFDQDINYTILVTMQETPFPDFNTVYDSLKGSFKDEYVKLWEGLGRSITAYSVYEHSQVYFISCEYTQLLENGTKQPGYLYYTVCDGKAIYFTLDIHTGGASQAKKAILTDIVKSASFENTLPKGTETEKNEGLVYTDSFSGARFTIPTGWNEVALTDADASEVRCKYLSHTGTSFFLFGSADYLDSLPAAEKEKTKRSDFTYSKQDFIELAKMFGTDASDVSYSDGFYYFPIDNYKGTFTKDTIMWCRFENAVLYEFIFGGDKTSTDYQEFKGICKSFKPGLQDYDDSQPTSSVAGGVSKTRYIDDYSHATFVVPSTWEHHPVGLRNDDVRGIFTSKYNSYNSTAILFESYDLYDKESSENKLKYTRDEFDNNHLNKNSFMRTYGVSGEDVTFEDDYYKFISADVDSKYGSKPICWCRQENGMFFCFKFFGDDRSNAFKDFQDICKSLSVPSAQTLSSTVAERSGFWARWTPFGEGFGILFILVLMILPMVFYRYLIRKRPLQYNTAIGVAGIDALIIAAVFVILAATNFMKPWAWPAILVGGVVNFLLLWKGSTEKQEEIIPVIGEPEAHERTYEVEKAASPANQDLFCWNCGYKLIEGSAFCNRCGKPTGGEKKNSCPKCGKELPAGVLFCHYCGTKLGE